MPRPPRPWFRFYSETLHNRKARSLLATDAELYGYWTLLMCLANVGAPRGVLPDSMVEIAFQLRVTEDRAAEIVSALKAAGFVDVRGKRLSMHDWSEWQFESDAGLTRGRAAKRESPRYPRGIPALSPRNPRAIPANDVLKRGADTEAETDQETETETETEQRTRARKRPLEAIDQALIAEFQERFPRASVGFEAEQFRDYCRSGKGKYTDHVAAFRKWVRKADQDAQNRGLTRPALGVHVSGLQRSGASPAEQTRAIFGAGG